MIQASRIIGTVLALGCISYLIAQQIPNLPALDIASPMLWGGLALSVAFYTVSQITAADAWRAILTLSGVAIAPALARSQLLVAQIGKYIPGNVAHLFGRIAIGRRDTVPTTTLGAAMVLEVGITLGVGLCIAGVLLITMPDALPDLATQFPDLNARLLPIILASGLAVAVGAGALLVTTRLRKLGVQRPTFRKLTAPLGLHMISFAAHGVSLWAAALAISPDAVPSILNCTLIFAFAWAAGFMMPGAPAGLGVRDSIIVLGLGLITGNGAAVAIAVLHRAVTIVGDVISFGIGWAMRHTQARRSSENGLKPATFAAD